MYYKYKYRVNPLKPDTIMLKPTWQAYAKALAPALVVWGGLVAFFVGATKLEELELAEKNKQTPKES